VAAGAAPSTHGGGGAEGGREVEVGRGEAGAGVAAVAAAAAGEAAVFTKAAGSGVNILAGRLATAGVHRAEHWL